MNRTLLAVLDFQKQFIRNKTKSILRQQPNKKHVYKRVGNAQRFGHITYYPPENFEPTSMPDPPKLFRVQRIRQLIHRNYWEKRILFDLGLINSTADVAVIKNTPENNVLLWKVKHLVNVEPITFPHGEPSAEDINHTHLKENGECIVNKKLQVPSECVEATNKFVEDPLKLDKETLKRDALLKWVRNY